MIVVLQCLRRVPGSLSVYMPRRECKDGRSQNWFLDSYYRYVDLKMSLRISDVRLSVLVVSVSPAALGRYYVPIEPCVRYNFALGPPLFQ